jgi:hypothetical protein
MLDDLSQHRVSFTNDFFIFILERGGGMLIQVFRDENPFTHFPFRFLPSRNKKQEKCKPQTCSFYSTDGS